MSALTLYVAVGVFAAVINGKPNVTAVANDEPFRSLVACQEHIDGVRQRAGAAVADPDSPLLAYGVECVKVTVEAPKGS
jgi:hypothetical protein